jgi:hypothetical protein
MKSIDNIFARGLVAEGGGERKQLNREVIRRNLSSVLK